MNPWSSLLLALALAAPMRADTVVEVAGPGLKEPFGTGFDPEGRLYVVEMISGNRLFRVEEQGRLVHIAGRETAGFSGDQGPALQAQFNGPHNLAVLPDGNVLIADTWNGVVRKVDVKTGTVSTLPGFQVAADIAKGSGPYCITLDFAGTRLYIADLKQVHAVDLARGTCSVVAGNGRKGRPDDGAIATEAPLVDPRAVAVDRQGNLYILERNGHALRVVGSDGRIRTVVNATGEKGGEGDGGPALKATMNGPKHLCVDRDDTVILADGENHLVRRYVPATGRIERIAGTGKRGRGRTGIDPKTCDLARPHGVAVHPLTGELYITDSSNDRVLKIVR
jgi:DNA-binding beta-propeller fold protein YncE